MSEEKKIEETELPEKIDVTQDEADAFKAMMACRAACEEVVHSVIREWEIVHMAEGELWSRMVKKYGLDTRHYIYTFDKHEKALVRKDKESDFLRQHRAANRYVDDIMKKEAACDALRAAISKMKTDADDQ